MRKYVCDNLEPLGEYCVECKVKIEARIKEGVN